MQPLRRTPNRILSMHVQLHSFPVTMHTRLQCSRAASSTRLDV